MRLSAIYIFPVKSCAGLASMSAVVEPRGLEHDRRWMIVDANGRFLTGRQLPRLVLVHATPTAAGLHLQAPDATPIDVAFPTPSSIRRSTTVWDDSVDALDGGDVAAHWLSDLLERQVRLVFMDPRAVRAVEPEFARPGDEVSFADGFPLLVLSQSALDGLNARLDTPLPVLRFRPNLVVEGTASHAEDGWRRVRVGSVEFDAVKPCTRCVFTTVDHERGAFDPSGEPLRTLKTYRRSAAGITFGMNLIARGTGTLRVGDRVEVLD